MKIFLFLILTVSAFSQSLPYSETGTYTFIGGEEEGIQIPIADFELGKRIIERGEGVTDTYTHLIYPSLKFSVASHFFSSPIDK